MLHRFALVLLPIVSSLTPTDAVSQRRSKPTLRLSAAQLGPVPARKPAPPPKVSKSGMRPVIMLTGYWPPTNEMLRRFSTNPSQNPRGWIGSNWENRGYDIHSFFPEYPGNSFPKGVGDFEVDYQDTVSDWWRITQQMTPRAIITFSNGGSAKNWELEMNAQNHGQWIRDYQSPIYPTPNPPDNRVPAGTTRRSTLPAREMLDALVRANIDVNPWACFRANGGTFLSEFKAYHGVLYKNLHSDRKDPAWCVAAGHIHVGPHSIPVLEQAVFVCVRELIAHTNRVTSGDDQQNLGFGSRGTAILRMGGTPLHYGGSQDLILEGVQRSSPLLMLLSSKLDPIVRSNLLIGPNPWDAIVAFQSNGNGVLKIPVLGGGGPATFYTQFVYPEPFNRTGVSNALEVRFGR